VSFEYRTPLNDGRSERHMLVDFGSTHGAVGGPKLTDVANLVAEHTSGKLDVLVISHRHRDHLEGFASDAARAVIAGLRPRLILRPWVDQPDLATNATHPTGAGKSKENRRFVAGLESAQEFAETVRAQIRDGERRRSLLDIADEVEESLPNREAIEELDKLAGKNGRYLHYGMDVALARVLPGVTCDVIGPPTIEQYPEVQRQRENDKAEFWLSQASLGRDGATRIAEANPDRWKELTQPRGIGPGRWLLENMTTHQHAAMYRLVRSVDDVLNNTSLILLFTVGQRRLLFPGDAQIENWEWVLGHAREPRRSQLLAKLADVDVYKVGHHGSRNATPKSLFKMWTTGAAKRRPMVALMSTRTKVHEGVPKPALVKALDERMQLFRTDELAEGDTHIEIEVPVTRRQPIRRVTSG
jgi:hypothetical protein